MFLVNLLANVFWNSQQGRPRTIWRLAAQLVLMVVFTMPLVLLSHVVLPDLAAAPRAVLDLLSPVCVALGTTASIFVAGRFIDRRPIADFGLNLSRSWWIDFLFGLALGASLMTGVFLCELACGWITVTGYLYAGSLALTFGASLVCSVVLFIAVGIYEELFSRGYQLKNMAEGLSWLGARAAIVTSVLISSAIFALLHAANPNATAISTFNIFLAGILLALGYVLSGQLAIPIGLHITWNLFQGTVFGFPVSGGRFGATFISISQRGDDAITGGAFGPEAGLIGVAAMLLGAMAIIVWVKWRHGKAAIQEKLSQPGS